jgi:hypothetical protein
MKEEEVIASFMVLVLEGQSVNEEALIILIHAQYFIKTFGVVIRNKDNSS